jgi:phosphatidylglycerol---prolipoprotein diacylglyceryl transferase
MLAVIPYTTFPQIDLGPFQLRTFGVMVGIGVLLGAWVAATHIERYGLPREETYRIATRLVIAGVIGARLTWDVTHWDQIDGPLDLIAVWEGGLQFSGGFVAAVAVGLPTFRRWGRELRWRALDGYAYGLTIGLAIGRIGCYSVGEHFGSESSWLLATRFDGGSTREPADIGDTFHQTALYELLFLLVLFAVLTLLVRRRPGVGAGVMMGVFCLYYGVARGLSDFLRVNDDTVAGLTGAQWMCVALVPTGLWILLKVRPSLSAQGAQAAGSGTTRTSADTAL